MQPNGYELFLICEFILSEYIVIVNKHFYKYCYLRKNQETAYFYFEHLHLIRRNLGDGSLSKSNENLTSKENGSVGGYMIKKMIEAQERQMINGYQVEQQQERKEIGIGKGIGKRTD